MALFPGVIGQSASIIIPSTSAISLQSNIVTDLTSFNLPAGSWMVWGNVSYIPSSTTTVTSVSAWTDTVSARMPDPSLRNLMFYNNVIVNVTVSLLVPKRIYTIRTPVTVPVYLSARSIFANGTMSVCGGLYVYEFS